MKFVFLFMMVGWSIATQAQESQKSAPAPKARIPIQIRPTSRLTLGRCSDRAFQIVKTITRLNGDSIITTSDSKEHELEDQKPVALPTLENDKEEHWQVTQDYSMNTRRGIVIARRVIYDIVFGVDQGGFCTILQITRTDKRDYFAEVAPDGK